MSANALKTVDPLPLQRPDHGAILEDVIIKGDLSKLSPEQRASYYVSFCESVGLNAKTQPLAYIVLNGKLTLYALKGATDQLRRVHGVSVIRVDKEIVDDLYVVTVAVRDATGRVDEDMGATAIAGLKGDAKVNAMLKAITKAKRRATLSICGLGLLDETETDSIPGARIVPVDTETGEILNSIPETVDVLDVEPALESKEQPQQTATNAEPVDADASRMRRLHAVAKDRGLSHGELHAIVVGRGKESLKELTAKDMDEFTNWLERTTPPKLQVAIDAGREDAPKGE